MSETHHVVNYVLNDHGKWISNLKDNLEVNQISSNDENVKKHEKLKTHKIKWKFKYMSYTQSE